MVLYYEEGQINRCSCRKSIVFVHGLEGHLEKTFTAVFLIPRPTSGASGAKEKFEISFNRFREHSGLNQRSGSGSSLSTTFWPFDLAAEPDFAHA